MHEPGLDRHEWETEWQALEPLVVDSPAEALPELDDLVGRMLAEGGYLENDDADPEIVAGYRVASEITRQVEAGEAVAPGDIGHAVGLYRELYDQLIVRQ